MTPQQDNELRKNKDPLHGITLEMMVTRLQKSYGWEGLERRVKINCFKYEPSIKSSLKFLRKNPWAKQEIEKLYMNSSFLS